MKSWCQEKARLNWRSQTFWGLDQWYHCRQLKMLCPKVKTGSSLINA